MVSEFEISSSCEMKRSKSDSFLIHSWYGLHHVDNPNGVIKEISLLKKKSSSMNCTTDPQLKTSLFDLVSKQQDMHPFHLSNFVKYNGKTNHPFSSQEIWTSDMDHSNEHFKKEHEQQHNDLFVSKKCFTELDGSVNSSFHLPCPNTPLFLTPSNTSVPFETVSPLPVSFPLCDLEQKNPPRQNSVQSNNPVSVIQDNHLPLEKLISTDQSINNCHDDNFHIIPHRSIQTSLQQNTMDIYDPLDDLSISHHSRQHGLRFATNSTKQSLHTSRHYSANCHSFKHFIKMKKLIKKFSKYSPSYLINIIYRSYQTTFLFFIHLIQFFLVWCIPIIVIFFTSVWICSLTATLLYTWIYRRVIPQHLISFPVYFNYRPDPILLTPYFIPFPTNLPISSSSQYRPETTSINTEWTGVSTLQQTQAPQYRRKQKICEPAGAHHLLYESNDLNNKHTCNKQKSSVESQQFTQDLPDSTQSSSFKNKIHPSSINYDKESTIDSSYFCKKNQISVCPTMVPLSQPFTSYIEPAVGFIHFNNRTWDAGIQGVTNIQRCMYYYQKRHEGQDVIANNILNSGEGLLKNKNKLFHTSLKQGYAFDMSLVIHYTPLLKQTKIGTSSIHSYVKSSILADHDGPYCEICNPQHHATYCSQSNRCIPPYNSQDLENFHLIEESVIMMIQLELFSRNCSLTAHSSRSHIIYRQGRLRSFIQSLQSLLPQFLHLHSATADATIHLIDKFPVSISTDESIHLGRIQITPAIPVISSYLIIQPRLTGIPRFMRDSPLFSLVLFVSIFTSIVSTVMTCCVFGCYVTIVRPFLRTILF